MNQSKKSSFIIYSCRHNTQKKKQQQKNSRFIIKNKFFFSLKTRHLSKILNCYLLLLLFILSV